MKKLVFAAQVFGISAMFPIVAFLELKHGARDSSILEAGKHEVVSHSKINKKKANETFGISREAFLLKTL